MDHEPDLTPVDLLCPGCGEQVLDAPLGCGGAAPEHYRCTQPETLYDGDIDVGRRGNQQTVVRSVRRCGHHRYPYMLAGFLALVLAGTMACGQESGGMKKQCVASIFWVGEDATADNRNIPNQASAWDPNWIHNFGGVDDPDKRQHGGYWPEGFKPKENPFYVALPYWEYQEANDRLELKSNISRVPWYDPHNPPRMNDPFLKNRWVEITFNGRTVFAQWEDVGPYETDDVDYVFGDAPPKEKYGIDLSPATAHYLGISGSGEVVWRFVDERHVPDGPWKEIVTTGRPSIG